MEPKTEPRDENETLNGVQNGTAEADTVQSVYLFILAGQTFSKEEKNVVLQRIAAGLSDIGVPLTNVSDELNHAIHTQLLDNSFNIDQEYHIEYNNEKNLEFGLLINATAKSYRSAVRSLLASKAKLRYFINASIDYNLNGDVNLQDASFSCDDLASIISSDDELRKSLLTPAAHQSTTIYLSPKQLDLTRNWRSLEKHYKSLMFKPLISSLQSKEEIKLESNTFGVLITSVARLLNERRVDELLEASKMTGTLRITKPVLYIFPAREGDSAYFTINGYSMLINGGYERAPRPCFWNFVNMLQQIDSVLLTHADTDAMGGLSAFFSKKLADEAANTRTNVLTVYANLVKSAQQSEQLSAQDSDAILDAVEKLKIRHYPLVKSNENGLAAGGKSQIGGNKYEHVNLYHKQGQGSLDMYVLSPCANSADFKEFVRQQHQQVAKNMKGAANASSGVANYVKSVPLSHLTSAVVLLVWLPMSSHKNATQKGNEANAVRILFTGNAPQNVIISALDKLKDFDVLQTPIYRPKTTESHHFNLSSLLEKEKPEVAAAAKPPTGEKVEKSSINSASSAVSKKPPIKDSANATQTNGTATSSKPISNGTSAKPPAPIPSSNAAQTSKHVAAKQSAAAATAGSVDKYAANGTSNSATKKSGDKAAHDTSFTKSKPASDEKKTSTKPVSSGPKKSLNGAPSTDSTSQAATSKQPHTTTHRQSTSSSTTASTVTTATTTTSNTAKPSSTSTNSKSTATKKSTASSNAPSQTAAAAAAATKSNVITKRDPKAQQNKAAAAAVAAAGTVTAVASVAAAAASVASSLTSEEKVPQVSSDAVISSESVNVETIQDAALISENTPLELPPFIPNSSSTNTFALDDMPREKTESHQQTPGEMEDDQERTSLDRILLNGSGSANYGTSEWPNLSPVKKESSSSNNLGENAGETVTNEREQIDGDIERNSVASGDDVIEEEIGLVASKMDPMTRSFIDDGTNGSNPFAASIQTALGAAITNRDQDNSENDLNKTHELSDGDGDAEETAEQQQQQPQQERIQLEDDAIEQEKQEEQQEEVVERIAEQVIPSDEQIVSAENENEVPVVVEGEQVPQQIINEQATVDEQVPVEASDVVIESQQPVETIEEIAADFRNEQEEQVVIEQHQKQELETAGELDDEEEVQQDYVKPSEQANEADDLADVLLSLKIDSKLASIDNEPETNGVESNGHDHDHYQSNGTSNGHDHHDEATSNGYHHNEDHHHHQQSPTTTNSDPSNWNILALPKPVIPQDASAGSQQPAPTTSLTEKKSTPNGKKMSLPPSSDSKKEPVSPSVDHSIKNALGAKSNASKVARSVVKEPAYVEVTYIPAHGNSHYVDAEFFRKVRARNYILSSEEPSESVLNALLEAKESWEDKSLQVSLIPTYESETLRRWFLAKEETLAKLKIEITPAASLSTLTMDENPELTCRVYKLEF